MKEIEVMTKEKALWHRIKEAREQSILEHKASAEIDREVLKYAEKKLKELK